MKSEINDEIRRPNNHDHLTLRDFGSSVRHTSKIFDTLETKTNILPKVDEKGNSECPFAEDLYAQKEEAADKMAEHLERLRRLLELLEKELARLRANQAHVQADVGSLHFEGAKEKYRSAKQGLEHHIQENLNRKKELLDLISQAEEMLSLARTKKWPLGKPKERTQFPSTNLGSMRNFGPTLSSGVSSHSGLSLEREVENLFSLGPLEGTKPLVTIQ